MAARVHPAPDDAIHRALAAARHAVHVTARAIARFAAAVVKWCRGEDECDDKPLCRSERKRLRKEKLRQLKATKKAA
jgi:hypothetical protein